MEEEPFSHVMRYYQKNVDEIQRERDKLFKYIESLRLSQETMHKQEWELKHRAREIAELQQVLNDSHTALAGQREIALKVKKDVDKLRMQAIEDRKKIMELLSLTNSVEQDITFFKDSRPGNALDIRK